MYPIFRLAKDMYRARSQLPLQPFDAHVSQHICWPQDIDLWRELNNGRTLTLYDIGRFALAQRIGIIPLLKAQGWILTIAGSSVRYRHRVRMFDRFEMQSRMVCYDDRFFYMEQSMWRAGRCTSHVLLRTAATDQNGIVPTHRFIEALGYTGAHRPPPPWVQAWIDADAKRPWPPLSPNAG